MYKLFFKSRKVQGKRMTSAVIVQNGLFISQGMAIQNDGDSGHQ